MCYSRINSTNFIILRGEFTNTLMEENEKQPLIRATFMEKPTQLHQIPKIPNHDFSMINSSG